MNLSKICSGVIEYSFYLLFFFVPLFWLPITYELFEFNKMILVYLLTVVITTSWVFKGILEKKFAVKKTLLDLPILAFLIANVFSTIFSLDPHTSIFGYYGRFHGGLLSTISYIILYYALVSNSDRKQIFYYLLTLVSSSLLVGIYGVLQHPNPLFREQLGTQTILHGIDYNYWAVDVENRSFSTLGQPNWLAAFLAMIIFPTLSLLFTNKVIWQRFVFLFCLIIFYLAFNFTYSRGGLIGIGAGAFTFLLLLPFYKIPKISRFLSFFKFARAFRNYKQTWIQKFLKKFPFKKFSDLEKHRITLAFIAAIIVVVFAANLFFGNAISRRGGINPNAQTPTSQTQSAPQPTQLEVGGQQTATIRTIVWKGSFEVFKHYPIFGSGVETFGYSYYLFRPAEHNLTAEWDYLYNRAHNEYLNYLATTGLVGFLAYISLIGFFEYFAVRYILKSKWTSERMLGIGFLAGYNSYLAQNFFGFSVVPIALLFFLFPVFFFKLTNSLDEKYYDLLNFKFFFFLKNRFYLAVTSIFILILGVFLLLMVVSMWLGDYFYNKSFADESYEQSIQSLRTATTLNTLEPLYESELAINLSALSYGLRDDPEEEKTRSILNDEAKEIMNRLVKIHPNHTAIWQNKRIVDFNIARVDQGHYLELLSTVGKIKTLAPTEASLQYDVALVYSFTERFKETEKQLEEVLKLKPDYRDAVILLARTYSRNNNYEKAVNLLREWLKNHPDDTEATELLKQLFVS